MGDHAVGSHTFGNGHAPLLRGGLNEHDARGSTAFAHVLFGGSDPAAAASGKVTPDPLAPEAFARRRVFDSDFAPVALELFGDHLREPGDRALAHLGAHHAHDDGIVGLNHHPGANFRRRERGLRGGQTRDQWHRDAERQTGARSGRANDELATGEVGDTSVHGVFLRPWQRNGSRRGLPERNRSGRYW